MLMYSNLTRRATRPIERNSRMNATKTTFFLLRSAKLLVMLTDGTIRWLSPDASKVSSFHSKVNSWKYKRDLKHCNKTECQSRDELKNGETTINNRVRDGYFLSGDVINYSCDDGFQLVEGVEADYVNECQEDGSWSNAKVPICVKSDFIGSKRYLSRFFVQMFNFQYFLKAAPLHPQAKNQRIKFHSRILMANIGRTQKWHTRAMLATLWIGIRTFIRHWNVFAPVMGIGMTMKLQYAFLVCTCLL